MTLPGFGPFEPDDTIDALIQAHGLDAVRLSVARYDPPIPTYPARVHDIGTSQDAAVRHAQHDVRRFGVSSSSGRLLRIFDRADDRGGLTDQEATALLFGDAVVPSTKWEAARRRCSDLRRAGFIDDTDRTARNVGGVDAEVWTITPLGRHALSNLRTTGWSWPKS